MTKYLEPDDKMTSQEKRQQQYRERYKQMNPSWDDSIMMLARFFGERAKPEMVVLDAGCGRSNFVLQKNRKDMATIIGIDAAKEATDGNAIADKIVIGNLENLPFEDGSFDAVTSLWVLEHVRHPERVFSEIARVLKPGGRFFFVTPYACSYILLVKRLVGGRVTKYILDKVYGRTEDDTFDTYYHANSIIDLRHIALKVGFTEDILIANEDPSYLAFNEFFFQVALFIQRICRLFGAQTATMHLIGVYKKTGLQEMDNR